MLYREEACLPKQAGSEVERRPADSYPDGNVMEAAALSRAEDAVPPAPSSTGMPDFDRALVVEVFRAEAQVCAAEAALSVVEVRLHAAEACLATLKAFVLEHDLVNLAPAVPVQPAAPVIQEGAPKPTDQTIQQKARRALARSGFERITR